MTAAAEADILREIEAIAETGVADDIVTPVNGSEADAAAPEPSGRTAPVIQVLKGAPTDVELAALVAVLSAAAAASNGTEDSNVPNELWGRPTFLHRGTAPFSPYSFTHLSHLRD